MSETKLRYGWTTGACAAAAARGAAEAFFTGRFPEHVTITLPRGQTPSFAIIATERGGDWTRVGVVKDAGDDPDVTHGVTVTATLRAAPRGNGIVFRAGDGVGTVTRAGLPLAVGEPAINPGPRAMIRAAITDAASRFGGHEDFEVTIAIPGGEAIAKRTLNARLGIVGGLSVLGTTGIVVPFSCAAWIHSIHRGIDVARAAGVIHAAASTGSTSEAAVQKMFGLPEIALIDMGDFVGGTLKYLRDHPIARVTIAGGFGKLAKLAQGHLDLHSAGSRVDLAALAALLPDQDDASRSAIAGAASAGEALELARRISAPLAAIVAARARETARAVIAGGIALDVAIFDRTGSLIAHAAD
jgi:cobalt-precorrin-5B (C1)-methyltransferase